MLTYMILFYIYEAWTILGLGMSRCRTSVDVQYYDYIEYDFSQIINSVDVSAFVSYPVSGLHSIYLIFPLSRLLFRLASWFDVLQT
jgi:hypothetical protein